MTSSHSMRQFTLGNGQCIQLSVCKCTDGLDPIPIQFSSRCFYLEAIAVLMLQRSDIQAQTQIHESIQLKLDLED